MNPDGIRSQYTMPSEGPDRFVRSYDELSDEEFLRRVALQCARQAQPHHERRLSEIADRLVGLRQLVR
jgi:hypothetical protein